jgi:DNA primase
MSVRSFNKTNVLRSRGVQYHEVTGGELNFDCQFCNDSRGRFFWNSYSGKAYCHNCGWKGGIYRFLSEFLGISWEDAVELVSDGEVGFYKRQDKSEITTPVIELPDYFNALDYPVTDHNRKFWQYMQYRGIPPTTVMDYGIGYCRMGPCANRVVIPVTWNGTLVSWVGRVATAKKLPKSIVKTLTPLGNHQSQYLLNLDKIAGRTDTVVLVEGPFDMLKINDMAVASFGKRLSHTQQMLMKSYGIKNVIIAFDDDAADDTYDTARRLTEMFRTSIIDMPPGKDPGDLDPGVMRDLVYNARPFARKRYR